MTEVIEWLESPAGEEWSKRAHQGFAGKFPMGLMVLKPDIPASSEVDAYLWIRLCQDEVLRR